MHGFVKNLQIYILPFCRSAHIEHVEYIIVHYCNNAASNNYDYITAQKQIAEITKQFSKMLNGRRRK